MTSFSTRGLDVRPGFILAYPMKERSIEIRYDDRGAEETSPPRARHEGGLEWIGPFPNNNTTAWRTGYGHPLAPHRQKCIFNVYTTDNRAHEISHRQMG